MTDRILVVDDEESMRDVLYRLLSAEGYLVSLAENGRSALAQLERNRFDFILCDIRMPEMGGLELLREI
ncbi:MAG TPA: response regulator, partial [Candidatus Bathyarchaeia archaeon]|nr:response regulator [Candidatus Bathyarchaeia archaeon]